MNRTPKHFDGTKKVAVEIKELLPGLLEEISRKNMDPREAVFREWFQLIGEKGASLTEPVSLKEWVLCVRVRSSSLYSVLAQYERTRLLQKLQEKFPLRDLIFRPG